ncbi:uncharacterized protein LOC122955925 [Acropora millepora]|uniref:uncharacterized protein LOC122955925 n=1 Tax=Acropora millepora TaxID=45264 RepID=UPI001CF362F2|nr:uncharacterized protein LOC122955925 [Acropora millepora]
MSQEEELAVNDFNDGLNFDGKNYEVRLPWKRDHPKLENNYAQAVKRLESIERKLKRDPEKAEAYTTAMNQYVEKGFAEEVLDLTSGDGSVRYLPHHAVFRADRQTTKCRIVFDASAREQDSVSLNDCVLPGPALQPNLASVLIRFRTHRIGMMADVEKMYLQIKLSPKDQDVHRYLWRDLKTDEAPKVYRMLRLTFGVNSSPFLAIATVNAHVNKLTKILFQELWRRGLEWDDPLDNDIEQEWSSWKSELLQLKDVTIPRWFGTSVTSKSIVELHGFGDASPKAYGAAVYIRVIDNEGQVSSKLVMSKSRVAPIKEVSLPRLELLAAVVNARLLKFVVDTLQIKMHRVVCWTDSMVTLHWIRRQSSCWKPFVANRVSEIQSTWDPECWHYCASKDNLADLLTRGLTCENLTSSGLWWNGPQWLSLPLEYQPAQQRSEDIPPEACEEERRVIRVCTAVAVKPFIDMSRYGTLMKLIRVIAYVLKAVRLFKAKSKSQVTELSAEEMQQAELKCCM